MNYHYLAFFLGLFGSVHCAAMCGPLLLAVQGKQAISWTQTLNKLLYQLGRISAYGLLGLILGAFGVFASIKGWQQILSLLSGTLLITIGLFQFPGINPGKIAQWQAKATQPLIRKIGQWMYRPGGSFVVGIFNGFLPCGMVYVALVSAMNADSFEGSFWYMVYFGLGTLPLMLIFSFITFLPFRPQRFKFTKILPFIFIGMGIWFLLRGADLGIPYLSPLIHVDGAIHCQ